ncbi:MAG: hypothetical protein AAGH42_13340 [Pseudomonadota bacterium]
MNKRSIVRLLALCFAALLLSAQIHAVAHFHEDAHSDETRSCAECVLGSFLGDAPGAAALICAVLPVFTAFVPFADERAAQRSERAASARGPPSA